jgi:protein-S-isoprenylcysteine O-methyltransferase Ste14
MNIFKSILHNIGVTAVTFGIALIGAGLDSLLGIRSFHFTIATIFGWLLFITGFLLRVWAAYYFYERQMKVIVLSTQKSLITSGPYSFSRNPLYLGGNVFMFFGAALLLGTPSGIIITFLHFPLVDWMVRREEKQLEASFGKAWIDYRKKVRRWL